MAYEPMSFAVGFNAEVGGIQNSLFRIEKKLNNTMEALSTGQRVNEMKDDEGGMAVADVLKSWKSGTEEAIYNLKEFATAAKIVQKALDDIRNILIQMRETVDRVQGMDIDDTERAAAESEIQSLATGINRIIAHTEYKGMNLFNLNESAYINQNRAEGVASKNALHIARFIRMGAGPEDFLNFDFGINPRAEQLGLVLRETIKTGGSITEFYFNGKNVADIAKRNGLDLNTKEGIRKAVKLAFGGTVKVDFASDGLETIVIQAPGDFVYTTGAGTGVHRVKALSFAIHEREYNGSNMGKTGVINNKRTEATYYMNTSTTTSGEPASRKAVGGLMDIEIDSQDDAALARVVIDAALVQIDEVAAAVSGMQHMIDSLIDQRMEEVVSAETQVSHIMDTDYAKELANFTKQQIAQQAGVNMLAQKRQMAQLVTQLLR